MALVKKCDRCGKLYEHYSDFNSCIIMVADKYGHIGSASRSNDLCPDCMQELKTTPAARCWCIGSDICVIDTNRLSASGYPYENETFYDKDTGVCYIAIGEGVTPLYNADGSLKIYKENKDEY